MENEKSLRGSVLTVARRYAAGIDVSEDAVRIAVLSQRIKSDSALCVDYLGKVPLAEGAIVKGDFIDRPAIVAALREAFGRMPENGAWRAMRCAIGLSPEATHVLNVPLANLIDPRDTFELSDRCDPFGTLEPAVLAEAERGTGIERGALAVDWSVQTHDSGRPMVWIAATARRHVEARVETAAEAGISLAAIDGEPSAALRAMRYAAESELGVDARYVVCWLERTGMHAWLIEAGDVEAEVRYPAPEYRSVAEALRALAGDRAPLEGIYTGGETDLLTRAGQPLSTLAQMFGCPGLPFESARFCNGAASIDAELRHSPQFAVAFGLALREVNP